MIALVAFVVGAVVTGLLWAGMRGPLGTSGALRRENYRGHALPVAAGIVPVLAVVAVSAAYAVWVGVGGTSLQEVGRRATIGFGLATGFGLLGLFDDLAGGVETKGFRGHIGALTRGVVTSGMVKLAFGGLLGLAIGFTNTLSGGSTVIDGVRRGVLIAASANLANLFDRAPGRVIKVATLGAVVIAICGAPGWWLTGPMLILGAGFGMLIPDLRERCMLGDTGANVLGAAVGFGLSLSLGAPGQWIALVIVVALNAASEVVSFTKVIDRVAPLKFVDRLGALPARRQR